MRSEDLLEAIGQVDDSLIEQITEKKNISYKRWLSMAASFLLIIGLGIFAIGNLDFAGDPTLPPATNPTEYTTMGTEGTTAEPTEEIPSESTDPATEYKVAMITDYGDITDQSFNQTSYEACLAFAEAHGIEFQYYKPQTNDTAARVAMTEMAIAEGYNVIVMPSYAFGATLVEVAPLYPEVKFIALDVAKGDILETAVTLAGEDYNYAPDSYNLADYMDMSNVYCATFKEELSGYMVGYAAVKLGYTKLGFIGGMAVRSVQHFGYGYIQGADDAAGELGVDVTIKYAYGNQFYGDADITATMDTWYADGTEAVFACGGNLFTSVAEAAQKVGGKIIGVDTDQSPVIDGLYGAGMTITSAMKGIYPIIVDTLTDIIINNNWSAYAGQIDSLGFADSPNPEAHYVQIPMDSTQWAEGFTQADYRKLLENMTSGHVTVSEDISQVPKTLHIHVEYLGNIKG